MDTNIIIPLIIAMVATFPTIAVLVNQARKDKIRTQMDIARTSQNSMMDIMESFQSEVARLKYRAEDLELHSNALSTLSRHFDRAYEQPTVVYCIHCDSPNVITNLCCTQCGAPLK